MSPAEQAVVFNCGLEQLVGIIHPGKTDSATGVLIIVGGPQYRVGAHRQFLILARRIADAGLPVFRFDVRGMGDSTGEASGFLGIRKDIDAALDEFRRCHPGLRRVVLLGLCDGASAALTAAGNIQDIGGLILLNPWVRQEGGQPRRPVKLYYLPKLFRPAFWTRLLTGKVNVAAAARDFVGSIRRSATDDSSQAESAGDYVEDMLAGLEGFRGRILLVVSGRDLVGREFLELTQSDRQWRRAWHECRGETVTLDTADHTLSNRGDLEHVASTCIDWLQQANGSDSAEQF